MIDVGITIEFPKEVWELISGFLKACLLDYEVEIKKDLVFLKNCEEFGMHPDPTGVFEEIIESINVELSKNSSEEFPLTLNFGFWLQILCALGSTRYVFQPSFFSQVEASILSSILEMVISEINVKLDSVEESCD